MAFNENEVRTWFKAFKEERECAETKQGKLLVEVDNEGRKYVKIPGTEIPQYIEEKEGKYFFQGSDSELKLKKVAFSDFIDLLTSNWLKSIPDGIACMVVLGALGKSVKMTWRFARGYAEIGRRVVAAGTGDKVLAALARSGANVAKNEELAKAALKLLEEPQSARSIAKALAKADAKVTKETALQMEKIIKEAWDMSAKSVREERAHKIGEGMKWFVNRVGEKVSGLLL
jgi:hypothetical protein